jgi:phosphonate transport system substrate-binding protein
MSNRPGLVRLSRLAGFRLAAVAGSSRRRSLLAGLLLLAAGAPAAPAASADARLRIAITPVLVEHYLEINHQLITYIGERLGRPTDLVQRRSYKEISDLLEKEEVDVAFVCGRPYVLDHERFGLELLAAPLVYDEPVYYSYVIVPQDSPVQRFEELRGKRYAFSDPLSNSGHLVPAYMLARMGETPDRFFKRYIFTYSHSANVEAVAVRFVDGASVDSYVYDYLAATNPGLTARTRIIERSPPHGITPVVVRAGLDPAVKSEVRRVLLEMDGDRRGRDLLKQLMIKRFVAAPDSLFDSIRRMLQFIGPERARAAARPAAAPR